MYVRGEEFTSFSVGGFYFLFVFVVLYRVMHILYTAEQCVSGDRPCGDAAAALISLPLELLLPKRWQDASDQFTCTSATLVVIKNWLRLRRVSSFRNG